MKNPTQTTILLLLSAIIIALVLIAGTDIMQPVMQFVMNTEQGSPLQLIGCIAAAVLGLRMAYVLLNMVGQYYAGELEAIEREKTTVQGGEQH